MESNSFLSNVFQPAFDLDEFLSDPLSQSGSHHNAVKGGLISESFSISKNMCNSPEHFSPKENMLRIVA